MLRPIGDQIVVEPVKTAETTPGGVVIPENARNKYHGLRAVVVAVGPGPLTLDGVRVPIDLKEGDTVVLRHAGPLINVGPRVFSVVSERDVLAVMTDPPEPLRRFREDEHTPGGIRIAGDHH